MTPNLQIECIIESTRILFQLIDQLLSGDDTRVSKSTAAPPNCVRTPFIPPLFNNLKTGNYIASTYLPMLLIHDAE